MSEPNGVTKPTKRKATRKKTAPPTTPKKLKLLITIVNKNKAEFYLDLLQGLEVNLQTCMFGRGTAKRETLHYLGLEETEKAVLFSIVREDRAPQALQVLQEKFNSIRGGKGIAYTLPLSGVIGVSVYRFLSNNRLSLEEMKK